MPSFGSHSRNYSWPPSLHHVSHLPHITQQYAGAASQHGYVRSPLSQEISCDEDMDDDPYSHFISPPASPQDESDDPVAMMSGAIHNTESVESKRDLFCANLARRWARSIRANGRLGSKTSQVTHTSHDRMHDSHSPDYGSLEVRMPSWVNASPSPSPPAQPDVPRIIITQHDDPTPPPPPSPATRARSLLSEARRLRRRRRTSRTLSGHRHSWQEPSPDLYTVLEEGFANDGTAVESGSDYDYDSDMECDSNSNSDDDEEELNSEDEALYSEDDGLEMGWPWEGEWTRPPERARL